jgi:hypothetical protein
VASPHSLFGIFTPSEIAECIDGLEETLYNKLWSLHPEYSDIPRENFDACAASNWWHRFSEEEQGVLNTAIAAFEARYRALAS